MKHLNKFNEENGGNWTQASFGPDTTKSNPISNSNRLNSKLDDIYDILKEKIKTSGVEDFYEAEEMIQNDIMKYLKGKLWEDDELSNWMKEKELGNEED